MEHHHEFDFQQYLDSKAIGSVPRFCNSTSSRLRPFPVIQRNCDPGKTRKFQFHMLPPRHDGIHQRPKLNATSSPSDCIFKPSEPFNSIAFNASPINSNFSRASMLFGDGFPPQYSRNVRFASTERRPSKARIP